MPIRRLFNEASFDPEMTNAMGLAYDAVSVALLDNDFAESTAFKEKLANLIITFAREGEGDPAILAARTLEAIGFTGLEKRTG